MKSLIFRRIQMFSLPPEIQCYMIEYLPVKDVIALTSCNRQLRVLQDNSLWNTLLSRDYSRVDRSKLPENKQSGILAYSLCHIRHRGLIKLLTSYEYGLFPNCYDFLSSEYINDVDMLIYKLLTTPSIHQIQYVLVDATLPTSFSCKKAKSNTYLSMERLVINRERTRIVTFAKGKRIEVSVDRQAAGKLRPVLLPYLQQGYILMTTRGYFDYLECDEVEFAKSLCQEGLAQIS